METRNVSDNVNAAGIISSVGGSAISFNQTDATLLGKLLIRKRPDVAQQLISDYQVAASDIAVSDEAINKTLSEFIQIRGIEPDFIIGSTRNRKRGAERRIFIAVILHLFQPHVFHIKTNDIYLKTGLVSQLARSLNIHAPRVSYLVRDVVTTERAYDDFRDIVQSVYFQMRGGANG
jgi:hypothetical protein